MCVYVGGGGSTTMLIAAFLCVGIEGSLYSSRFPLLNGKILINFVSISSFQV